MILIIPTLRINFHYIYINMLKSISSYHGNRNHKVISSSLSNSKSKIPKIKFHNVLLNNPKILLKSNSHHSLNTTSRNLRSLSYAEKTKDASLPYIRYVNYNEYYKLSNSFNLSDFLLKGENSFIMKRSNKNSINKNNKSQSSSYIDDSRDCSVKKQISKCITVKRIQRTTDNKEHTNKKNTITIRNKNVSTSYCNNVEWKRNQFHFFV